MTGRELPNNKYTGEMRFAKYALLFLILVGCTSSGTIKTEAYSTSFDLDMEILSQVLQRFSNETDTPSGELMVKVGTSFMDVPYVANTLDKEGEEQLVVNLREMDCTTFAENCLALTKTIQSKNLTPEQFLQELTKVRYRDAKINGYPSRLHYTTDWIFDNQQKKLVQDVTKEIADTPYPKRINFMSTHPDSYMHLKENAVHVAEITGIEKNISKRTHYYIPKENLARYESQLKDGDIVALTTSIEGLDVSHMGILVRRNGRIHLLHASLTEKKVVLSEETLEEYLNNGKTVTGIIIARPL
jgi:hypothetical protein